MNTKEYFCRRADKVARELLGSILIRRMGRKEYRSMIVETESYFDENDPASRAVKKGDIRETMSMEGGTILIYGIHTQWMLNFVTGRRGRPQAVLIRAVEPINYEGNTKGPGRLTRVLRIDKGMHRKNLSRTREIEIISRKKGEKIFAGTSKRIGVRRDLEKNYGYFIKNNKWVSR